MALILLFFLPPSLSYLHTRTQVARALARSFERADRTLLHYFYFGVIFGFPSFARVGSCAIALLVRGRELFVANGKVDR